MLAAIQLWMSFITHLVSPRKKQLTRHDKPQKWYNANPHQGEREKARRRRQLARGIIHN